MQDPANPNIGTGIDYLAYTYNDGNQLLKVDDNAKTTPTGARLSAILVLDCIECLLKLEDKS